MKKVILPVVLTSAMLQGCGSSSSDSATVSLHLTDAPIDSAQEVNIAFDRVEFLGESGTTAFDLDDTQVINLLDLQGSESLALLSEVELPAGKYNQIRLMIDDSANIVLDDGGTYPLVVPSADNTGFKLVSGFTLAQNSAASFTIDFDVRRSIVVQGEGSYKLKPTLRLVDNSEVGHISGSVAPELLGEDCAAPAVYAYENADVTPVDAGDATGAYLTSSLVDEENTYEIGFLTAGDYTVALTCEAGSDDPEMDDEIAFIDSQNVTVEANQTKTADFGIAVED